MVRGYWSAVGKAGLWKLLKIALGIAVIVPLVYGLAWMVNFFDAWSVSDIIRINRTQATNTVYALCGIYTLLVLIGKI